MAVRKEMLSDSYQQLVELIQAINFGCIENLYIENGEPKFEPHPRIIQRIKFSINEESREYLDQIDFELKHSVVRLIGCLKTIGTGTVKCIEVQNGLPFSMEIEGYVIPR